MPREDSSINRRDFLRIQVAPDNATGARRTRAMDDPCRRRDPIDAEIVIRFRQLLVHDLQVVHTGRDRGVFADEPELGQERELQVRVAAAFADADASRVHRHAAAHDEIDGQHVLEARGHTMLAGAVDAGGFERRDGEAGALERKEGF